MDHYERYEYPQKVFNYTLDSELSHSSNAFVNEKDGVVSMQGNCAMNVPPAAGKSLLPISRQRSYGNAINSTGLSPT
jgi:hypothetical protein